MKLGDALAGVMPTPLATQHENRRVHRLAGDDEDHEPAAKTAPQDPSTEETDMPRKKRKAPSLHELREQVATEAAPKKRKYTRKAQAAAPTRRAIAANGARFGVFSDGSVQIDAPSCKGNLSGEDVDLLYAFVSKLREVRR